MNICVYGASSPSINKRYMQDGENLGAEIAKRNHSLVFGGGQSGMMGAVAKGTDKGGGRILGIAPSFFNVDGVLYECDEFIYPETMRERKQLLEERSDAFVITAGGIGTMDEFFEILTLKQLGRHNKPIVILNSDGFYNKLLSLLDHFIEEKFLLETVKTLFYVTDSPKDALDYIENYNFDTIIPTKFKNI